MNVDMILFCLSGDTSLQSYNVTCIPLWVVWVWVGFHWIENQLKFMNCSPEDVTIDNIRVIWLFVMYYTYGCVRAIPTYRLYRFCDRYRLFDMVKTSLVSRPSHVFQRFTRNIAFSCETLKNMGRPGYEAIGGNSNETEDTVLNGYFSLYQN